MGGGANSIGSASVDGFTNVDYFNEVASQSGSEAGSWYDLAANMATVFGVDPNVEAPTTLTEAMVMDVQRMAYNVEAWRQEVFVSKAEDEIQVVQDGEFWDHYEISHGLQTVDSSSKLLDKIENIRSRLEHIGIHLFTKIIDARDRLGEVVSRVEVLAKTVEDIKTQLNRMERSIQTHKVTTVVIASSIAAVVGVVSSYLFSIFAINGTQVKEGSISEIAEKELEHPPIIVAKDLRLDHVEKKPIDFANERVERHKAAENERKRHEELRNAQQAGVKV